MNNYFLIDKLGVASYLAAKGLRLCGTEPTAKNPGILAFRFADPEHRGAALVDEYYAGGVVCAQVFDQQLARLKRLIWEYVHPDGVRKVYGREPIQPNYFSDGGAR